MIKIWGRTTSINVQKVMWAIGELELPHERIDAGGSFGKNNEPAYLTMNPNGLVPTLDEDGFILWESNSILRYIAAKYGSGKLEPADLRERVRETPPGEKVPRQIVRDGDQQPLSATIAERPAERPFYAFFDDHATHCWEYDDDDFTDQPHRFALRVGPYLGAVVTSLNKDLAAYFDMKEDQGLLVLEVLSETIADKAGLKAGDVITKINGDKVASREDLRDALADLDSGQEFKISIVRHGKTQRLDAQLESDWRGALPHLGTPFRYWPGVPPIWLDESFKDDLRQELDKLRDELKDLRQELKGLRQDI